MKVLVCAFVSLFLSCELIFAMPMPGTTFKPKPPIVKPILQPAENVRELLRYQYGNQITRSEISIFSNGLVMRAIRDTMVVAPPFVVTHEQVDEIVRLAWRCIDLTAKDLGMPTS